MARTLCIPMELRADFARREVVRPGGETGRPSPMAAAERYILDRIGEEVVRETSIVRCAAGARFSTHAHGGGEEFLVLAGSFRDDAGDYPDGTYVRNPIGTPHAPWTGSDGALLFVKLNQFTAADTQRVVIDTRAARWRRGLVPGLSVLPLHEHGPGHGRRGDPRARWCVRGRARRIPQGQLAAQPAPVGAQPVHRARRRADLREDRPPRRRLTSRRSRLDPSNPFDGVLLIADGQRNHSSGRKTLGRSLRTFLAFFHSFLRLALQGATRSLHQLARQVSVRPGGQIRSPAHQWRE